MKKIVSILGARPQFIKAAVLSRIISEKKQLDEVIVHTGQHFDANMSEVFFKEMSIPTPKYNLNINGLGHGAMTGQMLEKIEEILLVEAPELVVVYGDTNSTLAGALAAKKLGIKVAHIEAGLRSFNMEMPEEVNRILTDRISDLLLCPTETAINNLRSEGFDNYGSKMIQCGDIMKDSVDYYSTISSQRSAVLHELEIENKSFVLATIHRQENTDNPGKLESIFEGLDRISLKCPVIMPLHPRTKDALGALKLNSQIRFIDPVGYFDMLELLKNCEMVVTDSGGLQKEAFFNEKPCIVVREETEWLELVNHGFASLVGSGSDQIIEAFETFSMHRPAYNKSLYGDRVGEKIHDEILSLT